MILVEVGGVWPCVALWNGACLSADFLVGVARHSRLRLPFLLLVKRTAVERDRM